VATLKREQAWVNAEVAEGESQLASDGEKLPQAKQIIDLALDLAKDCATSYRQAADVRKMWNRAFLQSITVRNGAIADFTDEEPVRVPRRFTQRARWWTQGDSNR
jgi:hypothetical protein